MYHQSFSISNDSSAIFCSAPSDPIASRTQQFMCALMISRFAFSARIAARIAERRKKAPIETTLELVEIIKSAMPAAALREKQHPAKRSFQAIRIAVNDELAAEREALLTAMDRLSPGGRLCVISFHSLEDRIVKTAVRERENGCTCPREAPICTCGFVQTLKSISRKPILPSAEEIENNPRSRSAKLRVAERV